jgi:hypothetical protein
VTAWKATPSTPKIVASGKGKTRSTRERREERKGVWFSNTHTHISFKIYTENVEFNAFHLRRGMFIKDLGLELV